MSTQKVFQLSGTCNNYPWGRVGKDSLAAQLAAKTQGTGFEIKDDEHYSEMWFGDYPDFPAKVLETGEELANVLQRNKETLLGKKVIETLDGQLPFLPKILSIAKALPLQIHPNKDLATKLHEKDPDNFTDPNHKPEIAIALSKFEVFAGFKPLEEISPLFKLDALKQYLPPDSPPHWTDATLREVTRSLLKGSEDDVRSTAKALKETAKVNLSSANAEYIQELLPRLEDQYGSGDAGSLVALLTMNFFTFEPLNAIFIPADGIHAYLSGDIVECMARSNNVLNVGFCPRADRNNIDMFANTLTFKSHSKQDVILPSQKSKRSKTGKSIVYSPPIGEFDIVLSDLKAGETDSLVKVDGPGTAIVTKGRGKMKADGKEWEVEEGSIWFIAPEVEVTWETEEGLQVFMAYC